MQSSYPIRSNGSSLRTSALARGRSSKAFRSLQSLEVGHSANALDRHEEHDKNEAMFCQLLEARHLSLACSVYSVSDINDVEQTFRAKYRLICNVSITEEDFDRHHAMENTRGWAPMFTPDILAFNVCREIRKDIVLGALGQKYDVRIAFEAPQYWTAQFELDCETIFQAPFDFHRSPYDVQKLTMTFKVEMTQQSFNYPRCCAQWFWRPPWTVCKWAATNIPQTHYMLDRSWIYLQRVEDTISTNKAIDQFQVVILARRNWHLYFRRVIFLLFVINISVIQVFIFQDFDDGMTFLANTLLMQVALSLSTAPLVPHVPYWTYLDYYLYCTYGFMCTIVGEYCFARIMVRKEFWTLSASTDFQFTMWNINLLGFVMGNIAWVFVSVWAYKKEQQHFDSLKAGHIRDCHGESKKTE